MTYIYETEPKLYRQWNGAKSRCYNPKHKRYKDYGGRGIRIYKKWLHNPSLYIKYLKSLPNCNEEGYTLDRIHNDFGYEPMNLRWATISEQCINRRPRCVI